MRRRLSIRAILIASAHRPRRAWFTEALGNPKNDMLDIEAVAKIAHDAGVPLIIDNTVATPYLCRPFEWGADIVVHSMTKFLGGHGNSIGGIMVDSGKFAIGPTQVPELVEPRPELSSPSSWKPGTAGLRDQSARATASRHRRGPEPLQRVPDSAGGNTSVARSAALRQRPEGSSTPGIPLRGEFGGLPEAAEPPHPRAGQEIFAARVRGHYGFGIKGGLQAGIKLINALGLLSPIWPISGTPKPWSSTPASTTHQQLTAEEQLATGVTEDFVRLSVGIENVEGRPLGHRPGAGRIAAIGQVPGIRCQVSEEPSSVYGGAMDGWLVGFDWPITRSPDHPIWKTKVRLA